MAKRRTSKKVAFFLCGLIVAPCPVLLPRASAVDFVLVNNCDFTVFPGTLSEDFAAGQVRLSPGNLIRFSVPSGSSGFLWPRTVCDFDASSSQGKCLTGDCGGGLNCIGKSPERPVTISKFVLSPDGGPDEYGVSLERGFSVAMKVEPMGGGTGDCSYAGCISDLNQICPEPLRVNSDSGSVIGCDNTCSLTCPYFGVFKDACPNAKIYPYDDASPTRTCTGTNYRMTFCP